MSEEDKGNLVRIAPVIIWTAPVLGLKVGISYLRIKRDARKAVRSFRKGLREEGLPADVARSLVREYDEETSVFRRLASSAMNGFAFVPK